MSSHSAALAERSDTAPNLIETAWRNARARANVEGCFHDSRHTFVTDLTESSAGDQVIQDLAGHVSKDIEALSTYPDGSEASDCWGSVKTAGGRRQDRRSREKAKVRRGSTRFRTSQPSKLKKGSIDRRYRIHYVGSSGRIRTSDLLLRSHRTRMGRA